MDEVECQRRCQSAEIGRTEQKTVAIGVLIGNEPVITENTELEQ